MRDACIEARGQLGAIASLPRGFLGGIQVIWLTCRCLYWLSHLTGQSFLCVFILFYTDLSFDLELTNWVMPTDLRAPRIHSFHLYYTVVQACSTMPGFLALGAGVRQWGPYRWLEQKTLS